jgi:hypothetical protein
MRDTSGALQLYAVGSHNFADGDYVWRFDEAAQSFGCKYCTVFGEGSGFDLGYALGIWGAAPDDIYVVGSLAEVSGGPRAGRLYHYDGTNWSRVTVIGEVSTAIGVWGTARNDVWVTLHNGQLLHLAEPSQPVLRLQMYAGLTIRGSVGAGYQLQYTDALRPTNQWTVLTNLVLPTSPYLWFDIDSPNAPMRFYRAVLTQ